jgi:hypothetical protein
MSIMTYQELKSYGKKKDNKVIKAAEMPYSSLVGLQKNKADLLRDKAKATPHDIVEALRKKPDYYHVPYAREALANFMKKDASVLVDNKKQVKSTPGDSQSSAGNIGSEIK